MRHAALITVFGGVPRCYCHGRHGSVGARQCGRLGRRTIGSTLLAAASSFAWLAVVLMLALAPGGLAAQDVHRPLPHVSECNYCQKCAITPPSGASSGEASLLDGGKPGGGRAQWRRLQRGQQQHQQRLLATPAAKSRRGLLLEPERAVAMPGDADGSGHGAPMAVDQKPNTGSEQQQQQQQSAVPEGGNGSIGTSYASDRLDEDGIEDAKRAWEAIRGPLAARYAMAALAACVPGEVISDPHFLLPELLEQPADVQEKQLKPNCTRCYGCTARLYGMQSPEAAAEAAAEEAEAGVGGKGEGAIGGVGEAADVGSLPKPQYTLGGTPTWQFFARTPASQRRMVVKVFCMPFHKVTGQPMGRCDSATHAERVRLAVAQARLAGECGMGDLVPRSWLAPLDAVVPSGPFRGFHIRWWALWMEEARGVPLSALQRGGGRGANATAELLTRRVDGEQVVLASVFDLLTGQCDRHADNMFVSRHGRLALIDHESAMGVVLRCRASSLLLPTTMQHTALRLAVWAPTFVSFYEKNAGRDGFCTGPINPGVVLDYRCHVPDGRLGTSYPPAVRTCLAGLAASTPAEIAQRYGLPRPPASKPGESPSELLRRRASDLLTLGFEGTLVGGFPEPAPCYVYESQPPCCDLVYDKAAGDVRCATCWAPVLEAKKTRCL